MVQALNRLKESASQTAGPYIHIGATPNFCGIKGVYPDDLGSSMVKDGAKGERIMITGQIFDGSGSPIRDALVEIWQADADGLYNSPTETRGIADRCFTGFGRCAIDRTNGEFKFETIKPGAVPFRDGRRQAPHASFWIAARGINIGLHTRMYFGDEQKANAMDPILQKIEPSVRVQTLIAPREGSHYKFDIHLQGDKETVFFDI